MNGRAMNRCQFAVRRIRFRESSRLGVAGMLLILFLSILIGTFSLSVTRRAWHERRVDLERHWIATLESAIDAVRELERTEQTRFELPLDAVASGGQSQRWVEVRLVDQNQQGSQYQATLVQDRVSGHSIQRSFSMKEADR